MWKATCRTTVYEGIKISSWLVSHSPKIQRFFLRAVKIFFATKEGRLGSYRHGILLSLVSNKLLDLSESKICQ